MAILPVIYFTAADGPGTGQGVFVVCTGGLLFPAPAVLYVYPAYLPQVQHLFQGIPVFYEYNGNPITGVLL